MAFWSKKKKQTPPPAPPPAPLSVFLSGGRFDRDILCTLPQGTQVLGIAAEGENFPLLQFSDEATGRYYLFADEACRPNEDGWTGLLIITELLNDLLTRAGEEA